MAVSHRTPQHSAACSTLRPRLLSSAIAAAFVGSVGLAGFAQAQNAAEPAASTAAGTQLTEIQVRAKRDPAANNRAGNYTVIGSAQLEKENATDMGNIARYAPLISVPGAASGAGSVWDGSGNSGFNIRGLEGNRISLDIDGIALPDAAPKPDANNMNAFGIGRDYFDPETFREIRINSGTSATGAGTPGLGGSVAFETKAPSDYLNDERSTYADYKLGYSSAKSEKFHALTGAQRFGKVDAMVVYVHRDGEQIDSKGDVQPNQADWDSDALLGKLSWALTPEHQLGLTLDAFQSKGKAILTSEINTLYPSAPRQHSVTRRNRVSLEDRYTPANPGWFDTLDSRLYVQNSRKVDVTDAAYVSGGIPYQRHIDTGLYNKSVGFGADATKQVAPSTLLAYGLLWDRTETRRPWDEDRTVISSGAHQYTTKDRMADTDTDRFAAYLRAEFGFGLGGYKATLTPGLRAEYQKLSPKNLGSYIVGVPAAAAEMKDESEHALTPSLSLAVELTPNFTGYAQFNRGARMPTAIQRSGTYDSFSYTGAGAGYAVLGNPDLKKETSNTFELGIKGAPAKGLTLSASVFDTRAKNFIDYAAQDADLITYPTLSRGLFRPENLAKAHLWGGEVQTRFELGAWSAPLNGVSLSAAAGITHGDTTNGDTGQRSKLASVLPFKGTLGVGYDDPAQRGGVALTGVYTDSKQAEPDAISGSTSTLFAVPSATVFDFAGYWNINRHATLNFGVYNIGDKKYWDYASSRTLVAGTTVATSADIERQARAGRNYAVSLRLIY